MSTKSRQLYLIGGLPGSGKTTYAEHLLDDSPARSFSIFEADDFFLDANGNYTFRPELLHHAHEYCQKRTERAMRESTELIIVANTFTRRWERDVYLKLAQRFMYDVKFEWIDSGLSDDELAARNVHGVPAETIGRMRMRVE